MITSSTENLMSDSTESNQSNNYRNAIFSTQKESQNFLKLFQQNDLPNINSNFMSSLNQINSISNLSSSTFTSPKTFHQNDLSELLVSSTSLPMETNLSKYNLNNKANNVNSAFRFVGNSSIENFSLKPSSVLNKNDLNININQTFPTHLTIPKTYSPIETTTAENLPNFLKNNSSNVSLINNKTKNFSLEKKNFNSSLNSAAAVNAITLNLNQRMIQAASTMSAIQRQTCFQSSVCNKKAKKSQNNEINIENNNKLLNFMQTVATNNLFVRNENQQNFQTEKNNEIVESLNIFNNIDNNQVLTKNSDLQSLLKVLEEINNKNCKNFMQQKVSNNFTNFFNQLQNFETLNQLFPISHQNTNKNNNNINIDNNDNLTYSSFGIENYMGKPTDKNLISTNSTPIENNGKKEFLNKNNDTNIEKNQTCFNFNIANVEKLNQNSAFSFQNSLSTTKSTNLISSTFSSSQQLQKQHELCVVCGDKASGRHYGAISCEGCKGFFKRSIRKQIAYICRGAKDCPVTKFHRNRCQFCRLRKCLLRGMKSESVQAERRPMNAALAAAAATLKPTVITHSPSNDTSLTTANSIKNFLNTSNANENTKLVKVKNGNRSLMSCSSFSSNLSIQSNFLNTSTSNCNNTTKNINLSENNIVKKKDGKFIDNTQLQFAKNNTQFLQNGFLITNEAVKSKISYNDVLNNSLNNYTWHQNANKVLNNKELSLNVTEEEHNFNNFSANNFNVLPVASKSPKLLNELTTNLIDNDQNLNLSLIKRNNTSNLFDQFAIIAHDYQENNINDELNDELQHVATSPSASSSSHGDDVCENNLYVFNVLEIEVCSPLFDKNSTKFELPIPLPQPEELNIPFLCETVSRLLFLSVHWMKNVKCLASKTMYMEQKIKTKWRDLFVLGLVQCSSQFNLVKMLETMNNHLNICVNLGKLKNEKYIEVNEQINLLIAFIKQANQLKISNIEYAYLKIIAFTSPELLFKKNDSLNSQKNEKLNRLNSNNFSSTSLFSDISQKVNKQACKELFEYLFSYVKNININNIDLTQSQKKNNLIKKKVEIKENSLNDQCFTSSLDENEINDLNLTLAVSPPLSNGTTTIFLTNEVEAHRKRNESETFSLSSSTSPLPIPNKQEEKYFKNSQIIKCDSENELKKLADSNKNLNSSNLNEKNCQNIKFSTLAYETTNYTEIMTVVERHTQLIQFLSYLRDFKQTVLVELFFSGLIGNMSIETVMPFIYSMDIMQIFKKTPISLQNIIPTSSLTKNASNS